MATSSSKNNWHPIRTMVIGAVGLFACLCVAVLGVAYMGSQTPEFKQTTTARAVAAATQLIERSWTATPTSTATATRPPTQTSTPGPTDTPTSTVPPKTETAAARATAAAASPTPRPSATTKPTKAPSATPESAGASAWLEHDGRVIGVKDVAWDKSTGIYRAETGKILMSVYLIGINQGDGEANFNPFEFEVVDGTGQINTKNWIGEKEPTFSSCSVVAHGTCQGWWTSQVIDTPEVRTKLTLRWSIGIFSSPLELDIDVK